MIKITPQDFSAIIFDLDGVLIDSMPHHVHAWQEVFKAFSVELPAEELRRHEGEKAKITIDRLARKHGLLFSDQELDELIERKRQIYRQGAPKGLRPIACSALAAFRAKGFKTAIVTGSVRINLEWTLAPEELALFDVIVTSEECLHGKPDPEPFLRASQSLGIPAPRCLVIENAPLGIRSARAAGMTCIAIKTTLPAAELGEAHWIVEDLDQIIAQIADE